MLDVSQERFEELVADGLDAVPDEIARLMDNVVVMVEDGRRPDLMGLYEGVPLTERDESYGLMAMPDRITIYRRAILAACRTEAEVVAEVRTTVIHEVGHHFGIDDDRLTSSVGAEAPAAPGGRDAAAVAFPQKHLNDGEEVVLDLRPHWVYLAPATFFLVVAIVLGILAAVMVDGDAGTPRASPPCARGRPVLRRGVNWVTTMFVLTTDRIITRRGWLSKSGIEIPLERINTVFFNQRILERCSAPATCRSSPAGERGTEHSPTSASLRSCSARSTCRWSRTRTASSTGSAARRRAPRSRRPSSSRSSTASSSRARSPRSVRGREGEAARIVTPRRVDQPRPVGHRDAAGLGIRWRCTRFCEQPDLPTSAGPRTRTCRRWCGLVPTCRDVRRGEPPGGRRCPRRRRRGGARVLAPVGGGRRPGPRGARRGGRRRAPELAPARTSPLGLRAFVPIWRRPWMSIGAETYGPPCCCSASRTCAPARPTGTRRSCSRRGAGATARHRLAPRSPIRSGPAPRRAGGR